MIKDFRLTLTSISELIRLLKELLVSRKAFRVNVVEWSDKRGLSANAQYHVWIKAIAEYTGEDIKTAGNMCKLDFGLPILLADPELGNKLSWTLERVNFFSMHREQQVNFMSIIQVTSLMSTRQHSEFRDNIKAFWNANGLNIDYLD